MSRKQITQETHMTVVYRLCIFVIVYKRVVTASVPMPKPINFSNISRTSSLSIQRQGKLDFHIAEFCFMIPCSCRSKNLTCEESTDVFYHLLTFHLEGLHFRFTSVSTRLRLADCDLQQQRHLHEFSHFPKFIKRLS